MTVMLFAEGRISRWEIWWEMLTRLQAPPVHLVQTIGILRHPLLLSNLLFANPLVRESQLMSGNGIGTRPTTALQIIVCKSQLLLSNSIATLHLQLLQVMKRWMR